MGTAATEETTEKTVDLDARQALKDARAASVIVREFWKGQEIKPTPEALQATFATTMIHLKDLRRSHAQSANGSTAGASAVAAPDTCPKCGSGVYDNRSEKAAGSRKPSWPDFKCKAKNCDWAEWVDKSKRRKS